MEQIPPPLLVYSKFSPELNDPWASYSISLMWPNCTISTQLNMNGNDACKHRLGTPQYQHSGSPTL